MRHLTASCATPLAPPTRTIKPNPPLPAQTPPSQPNAPVPALTGTGARAIKAPPITRPPLSVVTCVQLLLHQRGQAPPQGTSMHEERQTTGVKKLQRPLSGGELGLHRIVAQPASDYPHNSFTPIHTTPPPDSPTHIFKFTAPPIRPKPRTRPRRPTHPSHTAPPTHFTHTHHAHSLSLYLFQVSHLLPPQHTLTLAPCNNLTRYSTLFSFPGRRPFRSFPPTTTPQTHVVSQSTPTTYLTLLRHHSHLLYTLHPLSHAHATHDLLTHPPHPRSQTTTQTTPSRHTMTRSSSHFRPIHRRYR